VVNQVNKVNIQIRAKAFMARSNDFPGPQLLGEALLQAIRQAVREEFIAVLHSHGQRIDGNDGPEDAFLTIKEAARLSRIAPSTIRLYIRQRRLRAQKVGRRVIIKRADLEAFLSANPIEILHD
jgi:excisionase family DNA binding protein